MSSLISPAAPQHKKYQKKKKKNKNKKLDEIKREAPALKKVQSAVYDNFRRRIVNEIYRITLSPRKKKEGGGDKKKRARTESSEPLPPLFFFLTKLG